MTAVSQLSALSSQLNYLFGPDTPADMQRCRVVDANADGYSWHFTAQGPAVIYDGNDNDADDYLFLPPVELPDSGCYRLHFQAMRGIEPQTLSVGFATAQSVAAIVNDQLFTLSSQLSALSYTAVGVTFHCAEAGIYYPVLRITSKAGSQELRCREFGVEQVEGDVRSLPMLLEPTPAQASEFGFLDFDGDGVSWRYRPDSFDFAVAGALGRSADDYLLLPVFQGEAGNYALDFEVCSENPSLAELCEVRYGPVGVEPDHWQVVLTHPAVREGWHSLRALLHLTDSVPYRAAIRYAGTGGDGLRVRRFSLSATPDSLLELPCVIRVDSLLQSGDTLWLTHTPVRTPRWNDVHVTVNYRGTGPAPADVALLQAPVPEADMAECFHTSYEMLCRGSRSRTASFYAGNYLGQTILGIRLGGEGRDGVVIESIELDSLRAPYASELPWAIEPDTLITEPTLFGPVWIENQLPALAIDVQADGPCRILWSRSPRSLSTLSSQLSADSQLSTLDSQLSTFHVVPKGRGKHYLTVVPGADTVRISKIQIRDSGHAANGPAAPALHARPLPVPGSVAQATVVLPTHNMVGMRLWENEWLTVRVSSDCDTVSTSGLPGDTVSVQLRLPQGDTRIVAACGNWCGEGPEGCDSVYGGVDAPVRLLWLRALPTADNLGVHLRWQADTVGANGAYADPDSISYRIEYTVDGHNWQVADTVSMGADARTVRPHSSQLSAIRWRVTPFNRYGTGQGAETFSLTGKPLEAPLTESFRPELRRLLPVAFSDSLKVAYEPAGVDPRLPLNRVMLLEETGQLLLPSFSRTGPMRLRLRCCASAGTDLGLEILTDGRLSQLPAISTRLSPDWQTLYIELPDSLVRLGDAATFRLTLRSGTLRISEYAIAADRPASWPNNGSDPNGTLGATALNSQLSAFNSVPGGVRILNLAGRRVDVCTPDGIRLTTLVVPTDDHFLPLSPAIYIIRCAGQALKLRVKS